MATGELFLGIASRIIKSRNAMERGLDSEEKVRMFGDELVGKKESYFWSRSRNQKEVKEEEIAAVVDDGDVVWEQRLKDVEAERERKAVTSPGFSFSAAGLLFPYHLGVAKFLIEKGYIKVHHSIPFSFQIICNQIAWFVDTTKKRVQIICLQIVRFLPKT